MVIYGKNQGKAKKKPPEGGFKLLAEEAPLINVNFFILVSMI